MDDKKLPQKEEIEGHFSKSIEKIDQIDLEYAFKKGKERFKEYGNGPPEPLARIWQKLKLMLEFLGDVLTGNYTQVPWRTIAAVAAAVLYFANPMDLVPDFIPGLGFVDDATVLGLALSLVDEDLKMYEEWKKK